MTFVVAARKYPAQGLLQNCLKGSILIFPQSDQTLKYVIFDYFYSHGSVEVVFDLLAAALAMDMTQIFHIQASFMKDFLEFGYFGYRKFLFVKLKAESFYFLKGGIGKFFELSNIIF